MGAVIHMKLASLPVELLAGSSPQRIAVQTLSPYSDEAIQFLSGVSSRLLKSPLIREYPDIAGFGYWCRRANLSKLAQAFDKNNARLGRGLAFHIAPANVPVNFAFSFAFGLLAGNANIVRVSSANHPQAEIILRVVREMLELDAHARIRCMTSFVRYPRDDKITNALSESADARIIWGGDATVNLIRSMKTKARCVDVCFADRYSVSLLGADAVCDADAESFSRLIAGFYNDVFLLDQNACSSPHLVLWQGANERVCSAKVRFWRGLEELLETKSSEPGIHALDKFVHLCRTAIWLQPIKQNRSQSGRIYRVDLEQLPVDIENFRGRHGFFFETTDNDLQKLSATLNSRYQTLTYYGLDPQIITRLVVKNGLQGLDRIVPVGMALDIGTVWDGYDLIGTLSRVIQEI